ncbi:TMEM14 family protein [Tundrisphaera sp. TA3]|uniref:TMEM14 family protein n=1 Tax=Tundrisphaera sp. TA3 TaxID=3435775 RepID=UPI003EB9CD34
MLSPFVGQIALGIYAALLAAGGLIGFRKAGSSASLIAGVASGVTALGAAWLSNQTRGGFALGAVLSAVMLAFFAPRFLASRKFMPGGLLTVVSVVVLVVMILELIPR